MNKIKREEEEESNKIPAKTSSHLLLFQLLFCQHQKQPASVYLASLPQHQLLLLHLLLVLLVLMHHYCCCFHFDAIAVAVTSVFSDALVVVAQLRSLLAAQSFPLLARVAVEETVPATAPDAGPSNQTRPPSHGQQVLLFWGDRAVSCKKKSKVNDKCIKNFGERAHSLSQWEGWERSVFLLSNRSHAAPEEESVPSPSK